MSFEAYLTNIKLKTGKTAEDFKKLAEKKGLLNGVPKAAEIVAWLKKDFNLGHGHAMAIYAVLKRSGSPIVAPADRVAKHFTGAKAGLRPLFDSLMEQLAKFGDDVLLSPTTNYISILREKKKFGIVQVTRDKLHIGIRLKGVRSNKRFEAAGTWNMMMTHRVRITDAKELDSELLSWMQSAYEQNA